MPILSRIFEDKFILSEDKHLQTYDRGYRERLYRKTLRLSDKVFPIYLIDEDKEMQDAIKSIIESVKLIK